MSGNGTVGKALDVLDQVAAYGRPVRFATVLADSSYPKATLYRLLQTLTQENLLDYDPQTQTYSLGVRLIRLAHSAWTQSSLAPIARPHLDRLSAAVQHTVHLAQLDHAQVLYVDKRNARQRVEMFSDAGKVGPAYCTGVGKAMMAFLPKDRQDQVIAQQSFHRFTANTLATASDLRADLREVGQRGYALDREEHEQGIICIAYPILTQSGQMLGALSITGTIQTITLAQLESLAPQLARTAAAIAADAQDWRFPEMTMQQTGT
ncbi:MAG: IclR family transcriptional regulator [Roseobacter sp.]|jgi:DNA-binding IclR family transcriptional regulator|nr:IclR family transcriptional regulator [Roseobacter sp.]